MVANALPCLDSGPVFHWQVVPLGLPGAYRDRSVHLGKPVNVGHANAQDYEGYKELKEKLKTNIAGGEAEFTKYGWNQLIKKNCIDIAQPEVCGLGGITEYLKVSAKKPTPSSRLIFYILSIRCIKS